MVAHRGGGGGTGSSLVIGIGGHHNEHYHFKHLLSLIWYKGFKICFFTFLFSPNSVIAMHYTNQNLAMVTLLRQRFTATTAQWQEGSAVARRLVHGAKKMRHEFVQH